MEFSAQPFVLSRSRISVSRSSSFEGSGSSGSGSGGLFKLLLGRVEGLHNKEDHKGHENEVNDGREERTDADDDGLLRNLSRFIENGGRKRNG